MDKGNVFADIFKLLVPIVPPKYRGLFVFVALVAVALFLFPHITSLFSQDTAPGNFIVAVASIEDSSPIPNARVLLQPNSGALISAEYTDDNGNAVFNLSSSLIGDVIDMRIVADGFSPSVITFELYSVSATHPVRLSPLP